MCSNDEFSYSSDLTLSPHSAPSGIVLPPMNILWPIVKEALANFRRVAIEDDRRTYTFGDVLGGAMFMAEQIDAATAAPHVGIMLPTSGAFPVALLGVWLSGGGRTAVPLNYLLNRDELTYLITDSGIDTIITAQPMIDFLGGLEVIPPGVRVLMMEQVDFTGWPPLRWPPTPDTDDLAVLLYTSGTSARPKGVMLTHGNLLANVQASIRHARVTRATSFLGVLPQFHSFGLTALTLIPLLAGSKVVYTARFVPKRIIELLRKHRPEITMFVPSMYGALLLVKDAKPEDFSSIRFAVSGGEPLPNATFDEYQKRFDMHVLEGYGLTETAPVLNWSTPWSWRPHSVGKALPNVSIVIADEENRILPPGQDGEILAAGPNVMAGYYHLPEETQRVFVELEIANPQAGHNGIGEPATIRRRYFRTGDIGHLDSEGFLFITGRIKEMLKVAGEIVFPREIEEALTKHPSVRACAVIGKPDDLRGQVPAAFVEINEGQVFDENALRAWCREKLAGFKVPREIRPIDRLPTSPTGKVLKRQLKAE